MFVGGFVRDALMNIPTHDVDLATKLDLNYVRTVLLDNDLKVLEQGLEHGSLAAVCEDYNLDITHLRKDVKGLGRKAKIALTDDWVADAQRRDFRLNALYADIDGNIYDPLGHGRADALAGRVSFIGDALQRIQEDYLRILRFFRFLAWYGQQPADPVDIQACQKMAPHLSRLSKERISHEVKLIFSSPTPVSALEIALNTGILPTLFHLNASDFDLRALKRYLLIENKLKFVMPSADSEVVPLLRFMAFLRNALRFQTDTILISALGISKAEKMLIKQTILCLQELHRSPFNGDQGKTGNINKLLFLYGRETLIQALPLFWIDDLSTPESQWQENLHVLQNTKMPVFPIKAQDLQHAHPTLANKSLGDAFKGIQKMWLDSNCTLTKDQCLDYLQPIS